ncbi:MAG TPA: protein kinase [Thermoanaerobaculia bacterium]
MALSPGTRLGPYEILSLLGAGGMGKVYRARDTRLGREVAIKVLPEALSADIGRLRRFEKEAQSASSLNHPNIVTVYDIGTTDSTSYIAMELVEGVTLRQVLEDGALPLKKALAVAAQVAEGFAKAHAAGIVHRDLKPENVMVTKDGFAKILDFGLAKLAQPEPDGAGSKILTVTRGTEPGIVMGTVGYMSPEQALGKPLDFRSDQFSLGSMLYEMVTGRQAFARATGLETMAAILRDEPEPVGQVNPVVPLPLRWILERCLAKDPEERYASTQDLARDVARLRQGLTEGSFSGALVAAQTQPGAIRRSLWAALTLVAGGLIAVFAPRWSTPAPADYHAVSFRRGEIGHARFAPDGQTIVYGAAWEGRPTQLFSTRVDSTEAMPLVASADLASISSSGKMAVAIYRDQGLGLPILAEVSLAGGAPREILEDAWRAEWAPDGQRLAVIRDNRLEFPIGKVLGSAREGCFLSYPRFSPDGREIAALENLTGGNEGASVVVFDVASGRKRTVSSGWGYAEGLAWHPRTGEIWFSPRYLAPGNVLMLCAVSPSSGRTRVVARPPGVTLVQDIAPDGRVLLRVDDWHESVMFGEIGSTAETNLSWLDFSRVKDMSDDGKTLLLDESGRGGGARGSIYLRKTDGSPATRLGEGRPIALSPDGKWVIATPETTPDRLVLLPTGAGDPKVVLTEGTQYSMDVQYSHNAVWMPDGLSFLFTARTGGKPHRVYLQSISGGNARPLSPEGFGLGGPVSPDGKVAVLFGSDGKFVLFPIDGGEPHSVPAVGENDDVLRWDRAGQALFVRKGSIPAEIWRLDIASGRSDRLASIGPSDATGAQPLDTIVLTPDGKTYAYSVQRRLSTLFVVTGLR